MDFIPEIIVQITFFPSGLFMGYLFYRFTVIPPADLESVHIWPYFVAIISAISTSLALFTTKCRTMQEHFYQLYFLFIATSIFSVSGFLFLYEYSGIAVLMSAAGHGIISVSALSYISVRVSSKYRSFRISLCHVWYLLGCAVAGQILLTSSDNSSLMYERIGITIATSSIISLVLLIANEFMHFKQIHNYRKSLDPQLQQSNSCRTLLLNRSKSIKLIETSRNTVNGYALYAVPPKKRTAVTFLLLLLKLKGFMLFSTVLMNYAGRAGDYSVNVNFLLIMWIATGGSSVGSLICLCLSTKKIFGLFNLVQVIIFVVAIILFTDTSTISTLGILLWIFYGAMGATYFIADTALLDTMSLKHTEILLCIGYTIEMILISLIQYGNYYNPGMLFIANDLVNTFYAHATSFLVTSAMLIILVALVYPDTKGKSLYEIRNELFGIKVMHELDRVDVIQNSLPPTIYTYNSRTGTYNYPKPPTVNTHVLPLGTMQSPTSQYVIQGLYNTPAVGVGFNRQYSNDMQMLSPGNIIPKAVFGGLVLGTFSMT